MSETGLVYTFTTPKLQPLVTKAEGKNLIQVSTETRVACISSSLTHGFQACLNAPEPPAGDNGVDDNNAVDSPEEPANQHLPPQQSRPGMPQNHLPPYLPGVGMDPQQALAYGDVQPQRGGQYLPPSGLSQHAGHQS